MARNLIILELVLKIFWKKSKVVLSLLILFILLYSFIRGYLNLNLLFTTTIILFSCIFLFNTVFKDSEENIDLFYCIHNISRKHVQFFKFLIYLLLLWLIQIIITFSYKFSSISITLIIKSAMAFLICAMNALSISYLPRKSYKVFLWLLTIIFLTGSLFFGGMIGPLIILILSLIPFIRVFKYEQHNSIH